MLTAAAAASGIAVQRVNSESSCNTRPSLPALLLAPHDESCRCALATDEQRTKTGSSNNSNNQHNFGFVISISICLLNGAERGSEASEERDRESREGEESLLCTRCVVVFVKINTCTRAPLLTDNNYNCFCLRRRRM